MKFFANCDAIILFIINEMFVRAISGSPQKYEMFLWGK